MPGINCKPRMEPLMVTVSRLTKICQVFIQEQPWHSRT